MTDNTTRPSRRRLLKAGTVATMGLTGMAGCMGDDGSGDGEAGGDGDGGDADGNASGDSDTDADGGAGEPEYELQAAVPTTGHPFTWALEEFVEQVATLSDDRIQINVDASGAYGDEIEQWETLSAGGLDIATGSILVSHAVYMPESISGVTNAAFVLQDPIREHFRNIVAEVDEQAGLRDIFRENNMEPLGEPIWTGNRHVLTTEPVRHPDDADGLPIRVPELVGWPDWFSAVGFRAETLAYGETYTALQTGTIEGAEGEVFQILADDWYEQADYYNLIGYYPNSLRLLMNGDAYEELPDGDKALFDEAYGNALENVEERIESEEDDGFDTLRDEGVEIVDDVDVDAFEEQARPAVAEWLEENDAALTIDEIDDLAP